MLKDDNTKNFNSFYIRHFFYLFTKEKKYLYISLFQTLNYFFGVLTESMASATDF